MYMFRFEKEGCTGKTNLTNFMPLISQFLQDILDKIFDMLTQGASTQCSYCTKVFHALVSIYVIQQQHEKQIHI